jgi:UDP-3-O-[3-hydroxymyristoyl] glucosamine N-acyltransferase
MKIAMHRKLFLSEIENLISCEYIGKDIFIEGLNLCDRPTLYNSIISYVTSKKYKNSFLKNENIRALFLTKEMYNDYKALKNECSFFIVKNPEEMFYELHHKLINLSDFYNLNSEKRLSRNNFHSSVIIENNVQIGENIKIGYNSIIKKGSIIGNNAVIGDNVVVGCEGFQVINLNGIIKHIEHVGGVNIGENVFIGSGTTISKALFEGHVIVGHNTKIDNQVHIGHNSIIGKNSVITGNCLLMGSVKIGDNVWIAPSSTISNRVNISDNSFIGSSSLLNRNTKKHEKMMGVPAINFDDYMKLIINNKKLILKNNKKQ